MVCFWELSRNRQRPEKLFAGKGAVNGGLDFLMCDASSLDYFFIFLGFASHVQGCVDLCVVGRTTDHFTTLKMPPLVVANT